MKKRCTPTTAAAATAITIIMKRVMCMKMIREVTMRRTTIMAAAAMTITMRRSLFIMTIPMIRKWSGM